MIARQRELLNLAQSEGRAMTADERSEFDSLQRAIEAYDRSMSAVGNAGHTTQSRADGAEEEGTDEEDDEEDEENTQRAVAAERNRIRQITEMCRDFGMEARAFIDGGSSVDQVRAAVIEHMRTNGAPLSGRVQVTDTDEDKFRRAVSDGLMMRSGLSVQNPAEGAQSFRGSSLRDLAIECLSREGKNANELIRMSSDDLYSELARQFYNPLQRDLSRTSRPRQIMSM